tara:strand:+ start:240 stop:791 length:552 start_codon:yes stop_codon:yes gene_type:complete
MRNACLAVGIEASGFSRLKWFAKYLSDGMNAVISDNRGGQRTQMTPSTTAFIQDLANKGKAAPEIQVKLQKRRSSLPPDQQGRCTPTVRSIQLALKGRGGKFTYSGSNFMVKAPWHARWRKQFCEEWFPLLSAPERDKVMRLEWILFTDEKKFCLWDSNGGGRWVFEDTKVNIAKDMTDDEYI